MKLSVLGGTWDLALRNNIGLLISNVVLSVALAFSVFALQSRHERIVLVPPHMDKKMEVAWKEASGEYLKSFGLYVATLIGNITPKNVTLVSSAIGGFLHPDIYPRVKAQVNSLAEDPVFQKANAINYFAPEQAIYEVDAERQKVFVVGQLVTASFENSANANSRGDFRWVTYEMTVAMENGRPWITEFTSYPGNQPHTAKWLASQNGNTAPKPAQQTTQEFKE